MPSEFSIRLRRSACSAAALNALCKACSHLFVDEAHHISANSWQAIREKFKDKRVVQFTATPFRNDKKSLGGKIVYNYTMGEAQRAGYFTNVNLLPVEEYYPDQFKYAKIKPEVKGGKVKIYRSATGDIEPGDWIGLDPKYAQSHSRTKDHKLYEMWVDKDDIRWQGADANEWIYLPKDIVNSEIDFKGTSNNVK